MGNAPSGKDLSQTGESSRERSKRPTEANYRQLLSEFTSSGRPSREAVEFLVERGCTRGQARNALYRFRRTQRHS